MRAFLFSFGRSRGVIIPNAMLERLGLHDVVDIRVDKGVLLLRPVPTPVRQGWAQAAKAIAVAGDDGLVWEDQP